MQSLKNQDYETETCSDGFSILPCKRKQVTQKYVPLDGCPRKLANG